MNWTTYLLRSAAYHWKSHFWVALAVAVATAVLTGAMIVGDSMRGSLRELAVGRLGRVDFALVSPRLFDDGLALRIAQDKLRQPGPVDSAAAILLLRGSATHAETRTRAGRINILGVDEAFWALDTTATRPPDADRRSILLNEPLASELGARVGDDVVLHLGKPAAISTETLLGRRDDTTATLRLTVAAVLPPKGLAAFDLNPRQAYPHNAFVPRGTLQRAIDQANKANVLLIQARPAPENPARSEVTLQQALADSLELADLGLSLRPKNNKHFIVESQALLIEPALEQLVMDIVRSEDAPASRFLAYLANTISKSHGPDPRPTIPYSTILAVDPQSPWFAEVVRESSVSLGSGGILLNEWAAQDLDARPGDSIAISYYITRDDGTLETRTADFRLEGIIPLHGMAADPDLVPAYKGVTDARSLADWDPPFPLNLKLIREKDEQYWDKHRTTPKALISLADGQRLWAESGQRFGNITSIWLDVPDQHDFDSRVNALISQRVNLASIGLNLQPLRAQMTAAASGPTDFGMLFLSFSFFLIASAAMLVALLFRLGVERRAFEIGLLLAEGFAPRTVGNVLLIEGLLVSLLGTIIGLAGAAGFAALMLTGLTSWWSAAVNAPVLSLHILPRTLAVGAIVSLGIAVLTVAWSVRGLTRRSARNLLSGAAGDDPRLLRASRRMVSMPMAAAGAVVLASIALGSGAQAMTRSFAFFASGAAALTLGLLLLNQWLGIAGGVIIDGGPSAWARLGARSAKRNRRRSLLTAGLIASATYLIVSLEAFRLDADAGHGRDSGSGGYALYAESATPLPYDLGTDAGRESLGVHDSLHVGNIAVSAFRLRPGEDSSCTNLYRPTRPRILGADDAFLARGGFAFAGSLAETDGEKQNPWLLLGRTFDDDAIPVIADANPVQWQYHLGLGKDLVIQDDQGRDIRLRFVALLANSTLQDELILSDQNFVRVFPSISGRAFFLIKAPGTGAHELERSLEKELEPYGFDAATTASRLRNYFAVQNTYISTFQSLGGLGLLLGTAGLAAVMVRNVWERRRELALLRTAGFTRRALGVIVMAENMALVVVGMGVGLLAALLAIAPLIVEGASLPVRRLSLILIAVLLAGLIAGLAAVSRSLRSPLIPSLRSE